MKDQNLMRYMGWKLYKTSVNGKGSEGFLFIRKLYVLHVNQLKIIENNLLIIEIYIHVKSKFGTPDSESGERVLQFAVDVSQYPLIALN